MSDSKEKTYRAGPSKVFGVEPGETFQRLIPPEQEARLIASGAITESKAKSPDVTKAEQTPVDNPKDKE